MSFTVALIPGCDSWWIESKAARRKFVVTKSRTLGVETSQYKETLESGKCTFFSCKPCSEWRYCRSSSSLCWAWARAVKSTVAASSSILERASATVFSGCPGARARELMTNSWLITNSLDSRLLCQERAWRAADGHSCANLGKTQIPNYDCYRWSNRY